MAFTNQYMAKVIKNPVISPEKIRVERKTSVFEDKRLGSDADEKTLKILFKAY